MVDTGTPEAVLRLTAQIVAAHVEQINQKQIPILPKRDSLVAMVLAWRLVARYATLA